jgi:hypothetical protein
MTTHLRHQEKELWEAADQLRAISKLTATEYSRRPELEAGFVSGAWVKQSFL